MICLYKNSPFIISAEFDKSIHCFQPAPVVSM